jgi:glutamate N-acetyltransferase/amino-acid N-acetyltransferase
VAEKGCAVAFDGAAMKEKLSKDKIDIHVALNVGGHSASVYTCDLTHEYITINAEYHT